MIQYPGFFFCSPPRTGSAWFRSFCAKVGLGEQGAAKVHIPPPADWSDYSVSIVRHPLDWLASYYSVIRGGVIGVPEVDQFSEPARNTSDVAAFIWYVADRMPGAVGRMFDAYQTSSVIRLEDFPWAPVELLQAVGVSVTSLRTHSSLPPMNMRIGTRRRVPGKTQARLRDAESEFLLRYGY